jgi:23S rRNA pseudouridine1911/1915/1917 synthase
MNTQDTLDILSIKEEELHLRLDKLLALRYPTYSRTYFQGLVESGHILINGSPCKKREKLSLGDQVKVCFELTPEIALEPENIPLEILFEDDEIIIVNKPAGMVVHPAPGHPNKTFVNALLHHCKNLPIDPLAPLRPGIVHRLDKDTSGALMAAKTSFMHRDLVNLLSQRKVKKQYKALCLNVPNQLEIVTSMKRHHLRRQEMTVCFEGGKEAITKLQIAAKSEKASLLDVQLITGRTHQIRVHLKHIGCPILGDSVYGNETVNQKIGLNRQLLHAEHLSFIHPTTKKEIHVQAPLPSDMQKWINKIFPNL